MIEIHCTNKEFKAFEDELRRGKAIDCFIGMLGIECSKRDIDCSICFDKHIKHIPKRWRAEKGVKFWYICVFDGIFEIDYCSDSYDNCSNNFYNQGNYFETMEQAQAKLDMILELLRKD